MNPIRSAPGPIGAPQDPAVRLRRVAHEFEAVFLSHVFREMRATVDGAEGQAEAMFTSMLDDVLAGKAAEQSTRGLGEALYRQLAARLSPATESVGSE